MKLPAWNDLIPEVESFLKKELVPYKKDFCLKHETYFKSGGAAKLYVMPHELDSFATLIGFLNDRSVPYKVVGLTTNVFFLDEIEYGVIITTKNLNWLEINENKLEVGCGYALADFVRVALINGYGGIEGLEGVPGTIGGGIVMNAGAYGYTISDYLSCVTYVDAWGNKFSIDKKACDFSYRNSIFKGSEKYIIISATFELPLADRRESAEQMEVFHIARHSYQEFSFPNLGSMFSLRRDFYRTLLSADFKYRFLCFFLKLIYKNPVAKFIQRKKPNNTIFNRLAMRYLSMSSSVYQPSKKSMNILINDGVANSEDLLAYMQVVQKKLGKDAPIENEVILSPMLSASENFKKFLEEFRG